MRRDLRVLQDYRQGLSKATFQFSLRSFVLSTGLLLLFVLMMRELYTRFGAVAACLAAFGTLSVLAHLAGAAIGSRLRDAEPRDAGPEPAAQNEATTLQPTKAHSSDFAPATQLSHKKPLSRKPILVSVAAGASSCAVVASVILWLVMWDEVTISNIAFGGFSAAVIGGLFGFWLSSLFQVARSALTEAQRDGYHS